MKLLLLVTLALLFTLAISDARYLFNLFDLNKDDKLDYPEVLGMFTRSEEDGVDAKNIGEVKRDARMWMKTFFNTEEITFDQWKKVFDFKTVTSPGEPQQLHLSITGIEGEMNVMWATKIEYGIEALTLYENGRNFTYYLPSPHDTDTTLHIVRLRRLVPGKIYHYRVGNPTDGWSKVEKFKLIGDDTPFSIGIYGDQGTVPFGYLVQRAINTHFTERPYDMNILLGDVAYADLGSNGKRELQSLWDAYQNQVEHVAKSVPWMVTSGNHEQALADTPTNYTAFHARFRMPENGKGNQFYSFDYGMVHYVSMNTEIRYDDFTPGSPQYRWLEGDLVRANTNRAKVPWVIFGGHRPMYDWNATSIMTHIEPLLVRYKVDMAFWGHLHCYFRTWPTIQQKPVQTWPDNVYRDPKAPIHLMIGSGGARINDNEVCGKPKPDHVAFANMKYGFGRLNVLNRTSLHFEWHGWWSGKKEDEFWVNK